MTSASEPPFTLIVVVNPGGQNNTEGNSAFGIACVGLGGPGGYPPGLPRTRTCVH
jgi:hypothetical protein